MIAAAGLSAYWYLSRGTGAMTLMLLTVTVVLGIVDQSRWRASGWPRFVLDALHRNVSLLVMAVLAIHVATSVLDSFAPIRLTDTIVPFTSRYRPIWVGFGALAFDLLLAIALTSLLRGRLGHRAWRLVHWLAYAAWPVAVVHGLGTGSDAKRGWMLALTVTCIVAVLLATWIRVMAVPSEAMGRRTAALAALIISPVILLAWLQQGPLASGWARRAGTPASLLTSRARARPASAQSEPRTLALPFDARLAGTVREAHPAAGLATIDMRMRFHDQGGGVADLVLRGDALPDGGVRMTSSALSLGPASSPHAYRGRVIALQDNRVLATARDAAGDGMRVGMVLSLDAARHTVAGSISARAQRAGVG